MTQPEYDDLWPGGPRFVRSGAGFALGTDSVLLADFAAQRRARRIADLGCGAGVLTVLLLRALEQAVIQLLRSYNKDIQKICLVAEGSLFWSENRKDKNYNILVLEKLQELLNESALADVEIHINNMNNANLIGTGIAALS